MGSMHIKEDFLYFYSLAHSLAHYMSRVMKKPVFEVSDRVRHKKRQAVQPQNMARGLTFLIEEVEGLFYQCNENKDTDQLHSSAQLIRVFNFTYAKSRFLMTRLVYYPV